MENTCYTYFYVLGEIPIEILTNELKLNKDDIKETITKSNKKNYSICKNINYDVYVTNMLKETLKKLFGKEDTLLKLKNEYNLTYYLEIVPHLKVNNINQCLGVDKQIIDFCYLTQTEIDIDLYLSNK